MGHAGQTHRGESAPACARKAEAREAQRPLAPLVELSEEALHEGSERAVAQVRLRGKERGRRIGRAEEARRHACVLEHEAKRRLRGSREWDGHAGPPDYAKRSDPVRLAEASKLWVDTLPCHTVGPSSTLFGRHGSTLRACGEAHTS